MSRQRAGGACSSNRQRLVICGTLPHRRQRDGGRRGPRRRGVQHGDNQQRVCSGGASTGRYVRRDAVALALVQPHVRRGGEGAHLRLRCRQGGHGKTTTAAARHCGHVIVARQAAK